MESIRGISVVLGILFLTTAFAADKPVGSPADLETLKAELEPLRQRAYRDPEVIAARQALDAAYRNYWNTVRSAMIRLEPEKKPLVEREVALRKKLAAVRPSAAAPKPAPPASPAPTPKKLKKSAD